MRKLFYTVALSVAAIISTAMTEEAPSRFDIDISSFRMIDCEYHGSETDMGYKNTIASNIAWEKYADEGEDSLVSLLALKFRGLSANEGAEIISKVNNQPVRFARYLSDNDTARLLMLFFPSSPEGQLDTVTISHSTLGDFTFPAVTFLPHGVYTASVSKIPIDCSFDMDTTNQVLTDSIQVSTDSIIENTVTDIFD